MALWDAVQSSYYCRHTETEKKWEKINDSVFGTSQAPQGVQRKQDPLLFIKICVIGICTHQESYF